MNMIRTVILAAALSVAVLPAAAQRRAPVSQGATSSSLASQIEQVRTQNAEMRIQMGLMVEDVQRLTGKVETLEFLLSQSRDEFNNMQADNQDLARQLSSLRGQISQQKKKITALESRAAVPSTTRSVTTYESPGRAQGSEGERPSTGTVTRATRPATSTNTQSGPRRLTTGATTTRTATVTTDYGLASRTETGSAQGTAAQRSISEGTQPVQSGSLGTLPASQHIIKVGTNLIICRLTIRTLRANCHPCAAKSVSRRKKSRRWNLALRCQAQPDLSQLMNHPAGRRAQRASGLQPVQSPGRPALQHRQIRNLARAG